MTEKLDRDVGSAYLYVRDDLRSHISFLQKRIALSDKKGEEMGSAWWRELWLIYVSLHATLEGLP